MNKKIAILGGGRIGEALLSGLLSSGWREASEIVITNRGAERVAELHERYGVEATADNAAAIAAAGLIVIAVKPQDIDDDEPGGGDRGRVVRGCLDTVALVQL